ncbi:SURF1 family protein [Noviherbaspirillum massiliense]|uniref:SURF1 family protein n=1 Tax=Noviherbaspirillum massiliense TaxID=1465823 RepID=UPI0002FFA94A|nr:SURF1 family protein [Noviherbaspirillum massiliense]
MTDRQEQHSGSTSMQEAEPRARSLSRLVALAVCLALAFAGFVALGTWQLYRLQWKLALIERVNQRVHAAPVPAPGPADWSRINAQADEYRHVRVAGTFLYPLTTRVQASTEYGGGYWLLTPLRMADDSIVLVNRGFVPSGASDQVRDDPGSATGNLRGPGQSESVVTGLVRMSEPGGAFLHHNDPAANRWYSRDVQAIAAARGLSRVAPYFVDADAKAPAAGKSGGAPDYPISGLTVISFHNSHLVYALTWYALALMVAGAGLWIAREERRLRQ